MQVTGWFSSLRERHANQTATLARVVDLPGVGTLTLARSVDCLGAMCPRPQLLTMKVLGEVAAGDVIEVISDNPTAVEGFPALALALHCTHIGTVREMNDWRIYLRKAL
jgi:TusA-related sulfurtransferase